MLTNLFLRMLNHEASLHKRGARAIIEKLNLSENNAVADIGSGGGYFFHHLSDPKGYFCRIKNTLKPEGKVAIVDQVLPNGGFGFISIFKYFTPVEAIRKAMASAVYRLVDSFDFLDGQSFTVWASIADYFWHQRVLLSDIHCGLNPYGNRRIRSVIRLPPCPQLTFQNLVVRFPRIFMFRCSFRLLRRLEFSPFRVPPRPNPNIAKNQVQVKPYQAGWVIMAPTSNSIKAGTERFGRALARNVILSSRVLGIVAYPLLSAQNELLLYHTEDGRTRVEVRLQGETVWMTQATMAELYQTTPQNITLHLKTMYQGVNWTHKQFGRNSYKFNPQYIINFPTKRH